MNYKFNAAAALAILPLTAALAQDPPGPSVIFDTISSGMYAVKGTNPAELPPNGGTFQIDGRNVKKFKTDLYHAKTVVVIFNGEAAAGRECPRIDLKEGRYTYDGSEGLPNLFTISAYAKEGGLGAEMAAVADKQCLIVSGMNPCSETIIFYDSSTRVGCSLDRHLESLKFWKR